jgi:hypothetical protein
MPEVLSALLKDRRFQFSVERAVFLTVLHRLFDPGSDRAAEVWRKGYALAGATLGIHRSAHRGYNVPPGLDGGT